VKQQEAKSVKAKAVSSIILGIFIVIFDYEHHSVLFLYFFTLKMIMLLPEDSGYFCHY
jgi:hypothetical protein